MYVSCCNFPDFVVLKKNIDKRLLKVNHLDKIFPQIAMVNGDIGSVNFFI